VPEKRPALAEVDPQHPFAGSPAQRYANGAAGIVPPKAKAVRGFSAKDVATAYKRAKKLLVAAHLDRPTLAGGRPDAFIRQLDADQRKEFVKDLDSRDESKNTRVWVTSFAPGQAELVGDVIKVNGSMRAVSTKSYLAEGGRELEIRYEYRLVYAVRKPGDPNKITRVLVHEKGVYSFYRFFAEEKGYFSIDGGTTSIAGAKCESTDGYVHPEYEPTEVTEEEAVDPYAANADPGGDCVPVSRI
jgi:hypothetical protein